MTFLSRIELRAMQAGIKQGSLRTARENVLEALEVRFEVVPPEMIEAVNQIEDTSVLKQLHRQAIAIPSIAKFQQVLAQASASATLPGTDADDFSQPN